MSTSDLATDSLRSPKRPRGKLLLGTIALVILAVGGWYYWQSTGEQETSNQPLIVTVAMGNIENTITASGSLQPFDFVDVGAQVSGQLQKLHVEVGDVVEQGQLLAEIDPLYDHRTMVLCMTH